MTPEDAICDIVTQVFPGSTCQTWRVEAMNHQHFRFRLVAGDKVWGCDHIVPGELVDAHPDGAAREIVKKVRDGMRDEMVGEKVFTSPLTGMPMGSNGFTKDGWYDTDQRRRDDSRLLALARIEAEHQEEEKAKASILDTLAQRALREG